MDKEFVKELCQNGLEYMFIGSLISSDNIITKKDATDMLNHVLDFEQALNESDLDKTKKDELANYILKAKEILNNDISKL
jgi:hypothetical protein